jgi:hypothetical protein
MSWTNSSLVTSDLFLGLEFLMYGKVVPSAVTILNLNEIVELVVLKEKLLMPSSDHIVILKNLNSKKIKDLGGNDAIDWNYEIKNLGKAHLDKPLITNSLFDAGVLVLDTEQKEDKDYRDFGDRLYSTQWQGNWILKSVGLNFEKSSDIIEIEYVRYMNGFLKQSSDPVFLKMLILAIPDLLSDKPHLKGSKYDATWMYHFYREVQLYSEFARRKSLGFTDTVVVQPFVALNFQHSENFIDIFYKQLKEVRDKQITELLDLEQPWIYNLPPLTTILLQRCRTLEDLPTELINLRAEFKNLRESLTKYQKSYEEAATIKDKLELKREFQNSIDLLMQKVTRGKRRIMKTIIDFAVDQSDSMIRKDFVGPTKTALGKLVEYVYDRRLYPWVNSFLHMYDESISIESDLNLYKKIFGDVNLDNFGELKLFAQNSSKLLNVHRAQANKKPRDV